jgi:uncharacterized repeat protein (TIGR04138 family)
MSEHEPTFLERIEQIAEHGGRYSREAYLFVYASLDHTVRKLGRDRSESPRGRHIRGQELCRGISDYARERYGPMARSVFAHWNVLSTLDFGRIVFELVDTGMMSKTEEDSLDDFRDVYDFDDEFDPKRIRCCPEAIDLDRL